MDEKIDLMPVKYELLWNEEEREGVYLEARRGRNVVRWSIVRRGDVLGKTPHKNGKFFFCYEPFPSSRDDEFYQEHRWETAEDAYQFWLDNRPNIIATSQEHFDYASKVRKRAAQL